MIKQKINNIYNKNIKIHMPFFLNDNILLCSFGFNNLMFDDNYYWKLGYIDTYSENDFDLINTGLPEKSVNCSPHGFTVNNNTCISFISDLGDFHYKLYSMNSYELMNFKNLKEIETAGTGIVTKKNIFYIKPESINVFNLYAANTMIAKFKNMHILRMNSSLLGLTFSIDHDEYGLIEILIKDDFKVIKIKDSNISPYKCHLYNDILAYTKKGDTFEDRKIEFTHDFYFENLPEELAKDIEIVNDWNAYL